MDKHKNVVIEVSLDPKTQKMLEQLKGNSVLRGANNIYFLHIYNERMAKFLPEQMYQYRNDFDKLEEYVVGELSKVRDTILNQEQKKKSTMNCIFNKNYKIKAIEYLQEVKADLAISATRGEQDVDGCFSDSFSWYLVSKSPCDVYVIRP